MRAVGADGEPLRVLPGPGVIWRGLEGDVERDLHAERFGAGDEGAKVVQRAQARLDGVVSALVAADAVGHAGVIRPASRVLFLPLRKARPIGWIGVR